MNGDLGAYGAAFADVYDDWYENVTDVPSTVETLLRLSAGGNVLEMGVGTGRIAVPLAERMAGRARLVGVDASKEMLEIWRAKLAVNAEAAARSTVILGDMATSFDGGPFNVVFCTFNTFFNLPTHEAQADCLRNAANSLTPGGAVVLEFAVFPEMNDANDGPEIAESRVRPDGSTVTSISRIDPSTCTASGRFIDDTGRTREWNIRWATPRMIDEMADDAGLVCTDRWGDFSRTPIRIGSVRQVCVMRRRLRGT